MSNSNVNLTNLADFILCGVLYKAFDDAGYCRIETACNRTFKQRFDYWRNIAWFELDDALACRGAPYPVPHAPLPRSRSLVVHQLYGEDGGLTDFVSLVWFGYDDALANATADEPDLWRQMVLPF